MQVLEIFLNLQQSRGFGDEFGFCETAVAANNLIPVSSVTDGNGEDDNLYD